MLYRYTLLLLVGALLSVGCRQDEGERLFDLNYLPREFTIPAGYSPFQALVFSYETLPTNFAAALAQTSFTEVDVNAILPSFARLTSLDNLDFSFLSAVSVRICPVGNSVCTEADEVFFLSDIYNRRLDRLTLDPGLRNVKSLMTEDRFKMEIVFFLGETSPYNISCRFDYAFEARR